MVRKLAVILVLIISAGAITCLFLGLLCAVPVHQYLAEKLALDDNSVEFVLDVLLIFVESPLFLFAGGMIAYYCYDRSTFGQAASKG